jgi:mRNA-degrading endonuclease RelE of RelBE toxin-antitoxin system
MVVFEILFAQDVEKDLKELTAYHRKTVLDAIEIQLANQPSVPTRNRKMLVNLIPPWSADPPIWELRIGEFRVFYDVSEEKKVVIVERSGANLAGR